MVKWCLILALACSRDAPRVEVDLSREHDSAITYAGVSFTTVFELSANEQSPLLVMLHGDTAKQREQHQGPQYSTLPKVEPWPR